MLSICELIQGGAKVMVDWNFLTIFLVHSHEELRLALETFDLWIWNDGFLTQKTREEKRHFYPVLHGLHSQQTFVSANSQESQCGRAMR